MIITKFAVVTISISNYQYYKNLGYPIPMRPTSKAYYRETGKEYIPDYGVQIKIPVEDLSPCCTTIVDVQCDHCGAIKPIKYNDYNQRIITNGNYYCKDCWQFRFQETNMRKYGFSIPTQAPEIRKKISQTKINQSREEKDAIQQKKIETSRKHYGTDYPIQSEEVKEAVKQTNRERYGVDYSMQNIEIQKRARKGMQDKYGAQYSTQVPSIRAKIAKTVYENQTIRSSKQQRYINDLYNGQLNGVVGFHNVDILIEDEKLAIEYDGKGHDLRVTLGACTQEEFNNNEIIRDKNIKQNGYKLMKIISSKDRLPSDEILLHIFNLSKAYFRQYPNHSWIEWNIDKSIYRNAEHQDGVLFNYGKLRKIKKSEVA